jgi:hypothetical protein
VCWLSSILLKKKLNDAERSVMIRLVCLCTYFRKSLSCVPLLDVIMSLYAQCQTVRFSFVKVFVKLFFAIELRFITSFILLFVV